MSIDLETQKEIAEELKAPATFDARAAVTDATYPEDSVDVFSDALTGHKVNLAANDAAKARFVAENIRNAFIKAQQVEASIRTLEYEPYAGDGSEAPGYEAADAEAKVLEAKVVELLGELQKSVKTFHVRGLAPAQWRLIDAKWKKAIKPPARKNFPQTEEGEEDYDLATYERNLARNESINNDMVASAIVKVVRKHDGAEDTGVWKAEDVAVINNTYLEAEFDKIKDLVVNLTFAQRLFQIAVEQDVDFLPKP